MLPPVTQTTDAKCHMSIQRRQPRTGNFIPVLNSPTCHLYGDGVTFTDADHLRRRLKLVFTHHHSQVVVRRTLNEQVPAIADGPEQRAASRASSDIQSSFSH